MAPKRKAASKPAAKSSVEDMPPQDVSIEDMSHITIRRPIVKDTLVEDNVISKDEENYEKNNTEINNVTVVMEEIPSFNSKVEEFKLEIDDEEELVKKPPVQKKVTKTKSKSKKQSVEEDSKTVKTRKRAASEDRQILKVEEKVVSKSRKRPIDKSSQLSPKLVSPPNQQPKRNQRAASVDVLTSETSGNQPDKVLKKNGQKVNGKSTKAATIVVEDEALKKPKKGVKKEDPPKIIEENDEEIKNVEKTSKTKKNTKKVLNEENAYVLTTEEIDVESVSTDVQEKPKSKRGIKKLPLEDQDEGNYAEKVAPKPASRSRAAPKVVVKQNDDVDKKQKIVPKNKKNIKSPENSEESSDKNETDNSNKSPEIKPKRVRKLKQIEVDQKDDNLKEIIAPKRGGRKAKVEELAEEVLKNSPFSDEINQQSGDLPEDLPDTPDSEKNDVKPVAAKRKTKAKSKK